MATSPLQDDRDERSHVAPSDQILGDGEPGIPSGTAPGACWYRRRVVVIAVIFVALPLLIAGGKWFLWTRTDDYQYRRVDAEASALIRELEGMGSVDRWIAMTALARDAGEAEIRAGQLGNDYHRIQRWAS